MTEQFDEQISEFIDDEMSLEECEFFVRRLQRDDASRSRYMRYQMIGAAVRGEYLAGIRKRVAAEVPVAKGRMRAPGSFGATAGRYAAGLGIAASVALVAVIGLRGLGTDSSLADGATGSSLTADSLEPASYVVPDSSIEAQQLVRVPTEVRGIQYLFQHTAFASGLNRTIMHSSVVAAQDEDVAAETEGRAIE